MLKSVENLALCGSPFRDRLFEATGICPFLTAVKTALLFGEAAQFVFQAGLLLREFIELRPVDRVQPSDATVALCFQLRQAPRLCELLGQRF